MLGDGCIGRNLRFDVTHAQNQLDWLRWKVKRIAPELGRDPSAIRQSYQGGATTIDGRNAVMQPQFSWRASNKELLQPLRELYYPPGRKFKLITPAIVECIDLEDFAWLVADDGTNCSGGLQLTSRLLQETAKALLMRVETLVNLDKAGTVYRYKSGNKTHPEEVYYLGFGVAATRALREALTPHLPECVHCKLREITEEESERARQRARKQLASLTPEQRQAKLEYNRQWRARRKAQQAASPP